MVTGCSGEIPSSSAGRCWSTVDVPPNSQILRIRYQDTVPLTAQRGADAFARAYLSSREADARAQATISQKSLQTDITRFQKQATVAEEGQGGDGEREGDLVHQCPLDPERVVHGGRRPGAERGTCSTPQRRGVFSSGSDPQVVAPREE